MAALRVLFIGGTGIISSACARHAVAAGIDLTLVNRGNSSPRAVPEGVETLRADVRDPESLRTALGRRTFDAVVDFVAFTPEHVQADIDVFEGRTGQYVFIGSASAYQKPPARLPITESTPLRNPYWPYSRDKIACEDLLTRAYRERGFPVTVVRPSQTYDSVSVPLNFGWTDVARMRRGAPVVVHGDGTSLWTLTHHTDFARTFTGLLGHPQAIGDTFHITSDELLTWNQIYELMAAAAGAEPRLVHVPSEVIAAADPKVGEGLLGDRTHSVVFDNSKVKALVPEHGATVPFAVGARQIVEWHDAHPEHAVVDPALEALSDRLVAAARNTP
ncbi:SDR family oxidoreductase [Thermobifida halotolerans]|uniref:SDR family oxidoreductase n=1 Tax=Thermobifida halotolerans TaxID=483545 RepID=A0A399GA56_9ACTN|nr:SDR family oxidoreductase [Thermobifida halotolerans]UOE21621.1 SDR family oxidoreductase [Thermobifida halotolerans]